MIYDYRIEISFKCPSCGNHFYGSCVSSFNNIGATYFSDGYSHCNYNPFWLTQCPRCKQYFSKEYLFKLPKNIQVFPEDSNIPYCIKKVLENDNLFGHFERYFDDSESKREFIEKAIMQGMYFPIGVSEDRKKELEVRLYKDLWHEYNMNHFVVSETDYFEICHRLLDMIVVRSTEDKLTVAELYRNIGDFEKCLATLKTIMPNRKYNMFTKCIQAEALRKNTNTVIVIQGA